MLFRAMKLQIIMNYILRITLVSLMIWGAILRSNAQNAVQLKQVWKKQLTGSSGDEILNDMAVHPDGTVLVGGRYTGTSTANVGGQTLPIPGASDGFLVQYDKNGTANWASRFSNNNNESYFGVAYGANKKPFAVGGTNTGIANFSYANLLISSADAGTGTLTNNTSSNGININNFFCVTSDEAGMVYGGGWFNMTNASFFQFNFGRTPAVSLLGNGTQQAMIVKHNDDRTVRWVYGFGSTGSDQVREIVVSNGFVYAVGTFQGTVDFNSGAGTFNLTAPTGVDNGFLLKLDTAGTFINAWSLSSNSVTNIMDVAINDAGHLFLAAYINGPTDVNLGAGTNTINSVGGEDALLIKMDTTGNLIWHRQFGNTGSERIHRLALNKNSDVYIGGYFTSASINLGHPTSNTLTNSSTTLTTNDAFLAGYDSSGNSLCAYRYGSNNANDNILALAFDTAQNLYVAGYFQGAIETEFAQGYSSVSTATGGYDAFVIKYNTVCPYLAKSLPVDPITCTGKTIQVKATIFGGNLTYQWKFNGANIANGTKYNGVGTDSLTIVSVQPADSGFYHLSVSRNGCATLNTDSVKVKINSGLIPAMPVLYYKFDGRLTENYGGTAAISTTTTYGTDRFGNPTAAINQQNTGFNIDIPDVSGVNYTVSMWVNHASNLTQTLIWGGNLTRELQISANKLGMHNGTSFIDFGYTMNSNTWYHIGYVKNGSRCLVYVNGIKVYENASLLPSSATSILFIAGSSISDGLFGRLDDLRIYNVALTDEHISTLYYMPQQITGEKQITKCEGNTVVLQSKISGAQSYQWYKNGTLLSNGGRFSGATTDSLVINNAQAIDGGDYILRAMNDCVVLNSDTTKLLVGTLQLSQNLIGNFLFNNTLVDASANITATGTINYSTVTRFNTGQSASILGASGRTSISFPSITSDTLSVSMWYMGVNTTVARTLLCGNTGNARHLAINNVNRLGYINAAGTFVASSATIVHSNWIHIVVTKIGNNQKIYVNGTLVLNDNNSFLNSLAANAFTRIGGASGSLEPANGNIDDVRIYNRELSLLEVIGLQKLFEVKTNPVAVSACNGLESVFLTANFEEADTTRYTLQWKKDGQPISNGVKYSGASAQTLWVNSVTAADTGNYTLEAIPTELSCLVRQSNAAKVSLTIPNSLNDSLRLHLRFSGSIADASANKRIQTAAPNITYTTDKYNAPNASGVFNGTSSHVTYLNVVPSTSRTFTVMAWFKANQSTGAIIGNGNQLPGANTSEYHSLLFIGTDNKLRGKIYNGNVTTMASTVDVNDNQWHHAALVATASEQYLYLDGVQVATQPTTSVSLLSTYMIVGSMFGGWPNTVAGWNNYFQGNIDEVKIYNRSLTANEINRSAQNMGFGFSSDQIAGFCNNTPATLNAQAVGSGVTYQWYKNGTAITNTSNITGSNTGALNFGNVTAVDSGNYQCVISKNCYNLFSDTIKVRVFSNIPIAIQPQSTSICRGNTLMLFIKASGSGLQYQWKKGGANLNNGTNISGATSDTLRVTNANMNDTGAYSVYITDACNNNTTSNTANVSISESLFPGTNTTRVVYALNANANANNAALNGSPFGVSGAPNRFNVSNRALSFSRANSNRVTLPQNLFASGNANFTVSIWFKTSLANTTMGLIGTASSNPTANPTTGWSPILFINNAGKLSGKFYDGNGVAPQSFATVTDGNWHQAVLTGNGTTQSLYLDGAFVGTTSGTYSTSIVPFTVIGASYSTSNGWAGHANGWQYFNGELDDARFYTNSFTLAEVATHFNRIDISTQPAATVTACAGASSQTIGVTASGSNLFYEWYKNGVKLVNGANVSGVTTNQITFNNIQLSDSGYYYVRIHNGCNYENSDSSRLIINNIPVITTEPINQSSCVGGSVALSVVSSGLGLTYQWQKNGVDISNGGNISGATSSTLTVTSLSNADTMMYRCIVTNACGTDTSSTVKISLGASLQILQQPTSQSVCESSSLILYVRTNDPAANFTWQRNNTNIGSANNDSLTLSAFNQSLTGNYRVIINSACGVDTSNNATLTLLTLPLITTQPKAVVGLCGSSPVNLSIAATGSGLSYQWQKGGVDIANATSATYIKNNPTIADTGNYQVIVSGACGSPLISTISRVNISQPVSITTQPIPSLAICTGNSSYVNLSVTATGSILGYQWYKNGNPINNQTNVTGATGNNLQFLNSILGAGSYTCKVFGACDTVTSNATVFGYKQPPAFLSPLESKNVCSGGNVSFKINTANATSFAWFINGSVQLFDVPNKLQGATTDSLTAIGITATDIGGKSATISIQISNGCPNQTIVSNAATLSIVDGITISQQSDTLVTVCQNQPAIIYVNANTQATYVWKRNGVVVPNQTNDTLTLIASQLDNGIYTCELSSQCGNITSVPVRLNVLTLPNPVITKSGNTLSTDLFTSYQWFKAGVAIANATQQSYDASESGLYSVKVVNSTGCEATSSQFDFIFTGINDLLANTKRVLVYPNPTEAMLTIETEKLLLSSVATIIDVTGKMVAELPIQQQQVDVRALASGVYLLKVTTLNQESAFVRFTKQ